MKARLHRLHCSDATLDAFDDKTWLKLDPENNLSMTTKTQE
jgi:hypothetical protein